MAAGTINSKLFAIYFSDWIESKRKKYRIHSGIWFENGTTMTNMEMGIELTVF